MASRGLRGMWVRGLAAAAASVLALGTTGAMVTAAVVGGGPTVVLTGHGDNNGNGDGQSHGSGDGNSQSRDNSGDQGSAADLAAILAKVKAKVDDAKHKAPKAPEVPPRTVPHGHSSTAGSPATHFSAAGSHTPAASPTPPVVVDTSDPAPFSAQPVGAVEAARVLPVESLGPLSGISFGSGLFIWPVLVAVDVLALAVIARLALRRRLVASDD